MPLRPDLLLDGLLKLDTPNPPRTAAEAAQRWFDAWWGYAQNATPLTPGGAGKSAVQPLFVTTLTVACVPVPVPPIFFAALEVALRAAWLVLAVPPFPMLPITTFTPAPSPLLPLVIPSVAIGLASSLKEPGRIALATGIHTWTISMQAVSPAGSVPFT
jgi:hypothetical protein